MITPILLFLPLLAASLDDLTRKIMALDAEVFDAYNRCDLAKFASFLAEDLEFYHDQGGLSVGRQATVEGVKNNICGTKTSPVRAPSPLSLKGVINIDGPADLESFRAIEQPMCGGSVVTQFLGGPPAEFPNRYREGSVTGLLPIGVRQELLIRAKGSEQWSGLLKKHVAAAEKAGDPVRMVTLKGNSHFDGINPQSPDWEAVIGTVRVLLGNP